MAAVSSLGRGRRRCNGTLLTLEGRAFEGSPRLVTTTDCKVQETVSLADKSFGGRLREELLAVEAFNNPA
jgi:hypothetical protein